MLEGREARYHLCAESLSCGAHDRIGHEHNLIEAKPLRDHARPQLHNDFMRTRWHLPSATQATLARALIPSLELLRLPLGY